MKLINAIFTALLFGMSLTAQAVPVTVTANGIGTYQDYVTNTTTYNVAVTATWSFDTADVPADSTGGYYSDQAQYSSDTDWIDGTISLSGGDVVSEKAMMDSPVFNFDYVYIKDSSAQESYQIFSFNYDDVKGEAFWSYASFDELTNDVLHGLDAGQFFSWTDNDSFDSGSGEAVWRSWNGSSYDPYASLSYNLSSMTLATASVPEPTGLALLGMGLLGGAVVRRRKVQA